MKIQAINNYNNDNVAFQGKYWNKAKHSIVQKIIDAFPEHTVKDSAKKREAWDKVNSYISRPAENRFIMGATALCTQPLIDAHNHKVDEETRRVSRNRTIAKIVAGTGVGIFVVRGPIYKIVQKMTNLNSNSKYSKLLLPIEHLTEIAENSTFLKNHRNALAMGIALLAMCITNFVLDAPLTAWLTNKLNEKTEVKQDEK